ncbi:MAG: glycosyltransferase family 4 protein [Chloroflexi bacterium]|nr:glycosyltransferase family 4 protein [Chloroflexota bacterium]
MPSICILTTVHNPFDSRIFHKEARSLARAGYRVTLLGQGAPDEVIDGVQLRPLPPRPPAEKAWRRWFRLPGVWRQARRENADVYLLHDPELTLVGLLLKVGGRRVVYDVHEHVPYQIRDKAWIPRGLRPLIAGVYDRYERAIVGRFDAIIAAFEQIAGRFPRQQPIIVRNVPQVERWRPAAPGIRGPDGRLIAVYAGVAQADRCILELVQAVEQLDPALNVELWIVGAFASAAYEAQVRAAAGDRVRLWGYVPHEQIPGLLAKSHIGLMSLRPQLNSAVNWPIKLFEYMAAGLPMLMTANPFWMELAGGQAVPVNIEDPADIARGLTLLAQDDPRRAEMGAQARQVVEARYNWADQEQTLLALFARLIGPPRP